MDDEPQSPTGTRKPMGVEAPPPKPPLAPEGSPSSPTRLAKGNGGASARHRTLLHLSRAEKEVLAKRHLSGETYADLTGYAGLSHQQIRTLFQTQQMRDIMASEQGHLDLMAARARLKLHLSAETSADVQIGLMHSQNEEMQYKASRFILESVLPQRKDIRLEAHVYHSAEIAVLTELRDVLKDARLVTASTPGNGGADSFSPYVLEGTEGIETAEPSDATPPPGVTGPASSGPAQDEAPDGQPDPTPAP